LVKKGAGINSGAFQSGAFHQNKALHTLYARLIIEDR